MQELLLEESIDNSRDLFAGIEVISSRVGVHQVGHNLWHPWHTLALRSVADSAVLIQSTQWSARHNVAVA